MESPLNKALELVMEQAKMTMSMETLYAVLRGLIFITTRDMEYMIVRVNGTTGGEYAIMSGEVVCGPASWQDCKVWLDHEMGRPYKCD